MKLVSDPSRDLFQCNSTSSIERYAPIFRSLNYDQKRFFKITAVSSRVQLIEGSAIFGITINVYCLRAANFESKLTLNSDESFEQFRERRRIHSFLSKNDVVQLERDLQFEESILRYSSSERQRKRSHIDGIRPLPFCERKTRKAFQ